MYKITIKVIENAEELKAVKKECDEIECGTCRHYPVCGSETGFWAYKGRIKKHPYGC